MKHRANPVISVCIPTCNGRDYLEQCIVSIRNQTFEAFEVVVCDDESLDGTLELARQLAQGDDRFRFISNPRRLGLVGNWNNCVEHARGEWIKFVFQDDYLMPACLERMISASKPTGALFLTCRREFHFEQGIAPEARQYYAGNAAKIEQLFTNRQALSPVQFAKTTLDRFCDNFVGEPTTTLLHRSVFDRFGFFNKNLIMCCDIEYWFRVGTQTGVTFVPDALAAFRVHKRSTSAENFTRRQFRTHFLDPLVILLEFDSSPAYRCLRQAARCLYGPNHLKSMCREYALSAVLKLKEKQTGHSAEMVECTKEWNALSAVYPQLLRLALPPGPLERTLSKAKKLSFKKVATKLVRWCHRIKGEPEASGSSSENRN